MEGNVYKEVTAYECVDHACEVDDSASESVLRDECNENEYCDENALDDGERNCLTRTDITLLTTTMTAPSTTTTTIRKVTITQPPTTTYYLAPTNTRAAETTSTTSTMAPTTSSTTSSTPPTPSFVERVVFKEPVELLLELAERMIDVIVFWD